MHAGNTKCPTALWSCSNPAAMSHVRHPPSMHQMHCLHDMQSVPGHLGLSAAKSYLPVTCSNAAMHTQHAFTHCM